MQDKYRKDWHTGRFMLYHIAPVNIMFTHCKRLFWQTEKIYTIVKQLL